MPAKRIGFLSFGHWSPAAHSQTRSASDALLQSIDLAVAAEELGADGAYFRVHHFARQLGSPFPLLAAVGAKTSRIEIGTAVIDMRYENPLYMAEDAGAADIIAGGRLQLGISRGSPEQVIDGWRYFGYVPTEGQTDADMARRHAEIFLDVLRGQGFAQPNPRPMFPNPPGSAPRAQTQPSPDNLAISSVRDPLVPACAKLATACCRSGEIGTQRNYTSRSGYETLRALPCQRRAVSAGAGRRTRFPRPDRRRSNRLAVASCPHGDIGSDAILMVLIRDLSDSC